MIAIVHDYFDKFGGGERLVMNLAKNINADLFTGFIDHKKTYEETKDIKIIEIAKKIKNPGLRTVYLMEKFKKLKISYDFIIFSGTICISAAKNNHPNLLYYHTPPRHMYDLKKWFFNNSGLTQKIGLRILQWYLYPRDQFYMRHFDKICPNSNNVKKRVLKYYGKKLYDKCEVVYTGIETKKFYHKKPENFFVTTSRLDPLKRLDLIINTFKQMPERKLVIVGTGPEEKRLKQLAGNSTNIKFMGTVSEKVMLDLYARCKASISANIDEDLGLCPIETQASGKPAIAVNEGGFKETVVNNKTGFFFQPNTESLKRAIELTENKKWNRKLIQNNVKRYDIKVFVANMKKIINEVKNQRL